MREPTIVVVVCLFVCFKHFSRPQLRNVPKNGLTNTATLKIGAEIFRKWHR